MSRMGMTLMLANRNRSNRGGNQGGQARNEMQNNYGMESNQESQMRGYDRDRKGRFTGEMEMNRTYEYGPRNMEMRGADSNYNAEASGGEMRGNYGAQSNKRWPPPYYDVDINRYEYKPEGSARNEMQGRQYGGGESRNEMEMGWDPEMESGRSEMRGGAGMRGGGEMRMIGFNRAENEMRMGSDASIPHYQEMDRMQGNKAMKGGASAKHKPKMDEQTAKEWTSKMENEDGTKGPHWTMDQVKKVTEQREMDCDPIQIWVAMNMMYSDYCKVAKKLGVNNMDFYVEMSKAFLEDKDAGAEDKLAAYYEYVVKGQ